MSTNTSILLALRNWEFEHVRMNKLLEQLSDEQLLKEVAPGKNRGVYLLGHLTAANDGIRKLLDLGGRLHPELDQIFLSVPDKSVPEIPATPLLRAMWKEVMDKIAEDVQTLSDDEWLSKHTAVSAEDFVKEPHRNKLSIILSRTVHQAYHAGQMALLK